MMPLAPLVEGQDLGGRQQKRRARPRIGWQPHGHHSDALAAEAAAQFAPDVPCSAIQ